MSRLHYFGEHYPALWYGLAAMVGAAASLLDPILVLFPFALVLFLLLLGVLNKMWPLACRLALCCGIIIATYAYAIPFRTVQLPPTGIHGTASLTFHSLKQKRSSFGTRWVAEATLKNFNADMGKTFSSLPIQLSFSPANDTFLPVLQWEWSVQGTLRNTTQNGHYFFKPDNHARWIPQGFTLSGYFAGLRQSLKEKIKNYLMTVMEPTVSAPFLHGMFTGEFNDVVLKHQFGIFGLQHILAISGFHFSLLAAILALTLSLFFSYRQIGVILCVILTCYFLLLGTSPSILRAWMTLLLAGIALFLQRRSSGLNLLGVSLLFIVLYDPWCITQVGFQCSFGITAAILLFCRPIENLLEPLFPTRSLSTVIRWDSLSQHTYVIACWLRKSLALNGAVNLVATPLLIFHYQSFPVFSLIYNLFFPFLIGISLLLLIVGTLFHAVFGAFGLWLHALNGQYTFYVIGIATHAPRSLDVKLYFPEFPAIYLVLLLSLIFGYGMWLATSPVEEDELIF